MIREKKMKAIFYIILLAALGYGGLYVYENYLAESVNHTIANTADFATDAKVKNFDANNMQ